LKSNRSAIKKFQGSTLAESCKNFDPFTCILNCNHF
jgi:hypothetical protein